MDQLNRERKRVIKETMEVMKELMLEVTALEEAAEGEAVEVEDVAAGVDVEAEAVVADSLQVFNN